MATGNVRTQTTPTASNHATVVVSADSPATVGFNKARRDLSKVFLVGVATALLTGSSGLAVILSTGCIFFLKQGTWLSIKNIKWGILSIVSFVVSLSSMVLMQCSSIVDASEAYSLRMTLLVMAVFMSRFWSVVLAIFLLSAFTSNSSVSNNRNDGSCTMMMKDGKEKTNIYRPKQT
jgi:uncharacterized membrane protein